MDFDLSKPQRLLQGSVREFLARHCPVSRVRELMETSTAFDRELWNGFVDQGWTGLTIPEKWGGLGLGAVDLAAVAEILGESCVPGPFLSNAWATAVLTAAVGQPHAGGVLERIAGGSLIATVALLEESGDWDPDAVRLEAKPIEGQFRLDGDKLFVPDAAVADLILWPARLDGTPAIFMIPRDSPGVSVTPMPAIDQTRKLYQASLNGLVLAKEGLLAAGDAAAAALSAGTREATVCACAELLGSMSWIQKTAVEYAKTRRQFDRPIGAFQAVQHRCADMLVEVEAARAAAYYAAWAVSVQDPEAERLVSVAKAFCSDAGREVGNSGIQVHGGIGFTWEHDLQLYFKRTKSLEILFGDATFHRERIARLIVDRAS